MIWWRYIDNVFFIWENDKESPKVFVDGGLKTDLFDKPADTHQFLDPTFPILITAKKEYLTVEL